MRVRKLLVAAAFAMLVSFAFQTEPIPQHEPDGNPQHDGQPEFCQSETRGKYAANCKCRDMEKPHCPGPDNDNGDGLEPDEPTRGESPKCKVYCRKTKCFCSSPCNG